MKKDCEVALIAINSLLKTEQEWDQQEFKKWATTNTATQADLDRYNRDARDKSEPDFCREPALVKGDPCYELDHRNPYYQTLYWSSCAYDACNIHYNDKVTSGWFPSKPRICRHKWYKCMDDECEHHLIDKRENNRFPGEDEREAVLKYLVINKVCINNIWQRCMNDDCKAHKQDKSINGFGDEGSFLGQSAETPMRGRSTICRAPGTDPKTPMGPIRSLSYPSC
jgi:hypothetical protein